MLSPVEQTFQRQVRAYLAPHGTHLSKVLERLIQHRYPPEVAVIDFEVFSDGFTTGFPVRAFFLDHHNTEFFQFIDGKAAYPCPVDPGLLEIDSVYPEKLENELTSASPESDPWHLATEEFLTWFHSCWLSAGGNGFGLHATIAHHDSTKELNLLTGAVQPRGASFSA
jgi:hypothetical protein